MKIHESSYTTDAHNFHVNVYGNEVHVALTYPALGGCQYVVVDQESVRASDGVRLHYDYERDGFVIEQASTFSWDGGDEVCDPDWQEVAFIRSWAREKQSEE